jgi:molybdopterin-guanine dinucleotide biosynthesis protein A
MLILAGGMSKRMGEDKALIRYQNQIQLNRILQMSAELNLPSYLSVRSNQSHWGEEFGVEVIEDILINAGPVSGIVSAMKSDANCAWLVVACDLPLLSSTDLKLLIESRDSQKIATCFQAPIDGGPEPLCTIWEPEAINPLLNWWAKGVNCPRKTLFNSNVKIIKPNDNSVLFNANTPEEREEVKSKL